MHGKSPGQALQQQQQQQQQQQEPQNQLSCTQQPSAKQQREQRKKRKPIRAADDASMPENVRLDTATNISIRQSVHAGGIQESRTAECALQHQQQQQQQQQQQAKKKTVRMQPSTDATEGRPQLVTASQVPSSNHTKHDHVPVPDVPPSLFEIPAQQQARPSSGSTASPSSQRGHQKPSVEGVGPESAQHPHIKVSTSHQKWARLDKLEAQNTAFPALKSGHAPDGAHQSAGTPSVQQQQPLDSSRGHLIPKQLTPKQPRQVFPEGIAHDDLSALKSGCSKRRRTTSEQPQSGPDASSAGMQGGNGLQASTMQHPQKHLSKRRAHAVRPQPSPDMPAQASQLSSQLADQGAQDHAAPAVPAHQSQGAQRAGGSKSRRGSGLLDQMRAKLSGGHFRWLNEQLYTTTGDAALDFMTVNPSYFDEYHKVRLESPGHGIKPFVCLRDCWTALPMIQPSAGAQVCQAELVISVYCEADLRAPRVVQLPFCNVVRLLDKRQVSCHVPCRLRIMPRSYAAQSHHAPH